MKVRDLIAELSELDLDAEIEIFIEDSNTVGKPYEARMTQLPGYAIIVAKGNW